jgi:cytochrome c1
VVAVLAGLGDPIPALTPAEQAALVEYLQSL